MLGHVQMQLAMIVVVEQQIDQRHHEQQLYLVQQLVDWQHSVLQKLHLCWSH